jgi:bifunctional non-homologous end joining protein LigD
LSLTAYKRKRNSKSTKELEDNKKPSDKNLIFVVQKHNASRLHYDFRLELNGVLKSWAIPKGPSMNPADKRLAMMVEDHPYDYKDFEGIIAEGNYGAGEVIVWDKGVYMPIDGTPDKKENEKKLTAALHKGDLKIVLLGKKLKGEFALIKMKSKSDNSWLLIKKRDEYALSKDITSENKSVLSNRTVEDLKKESNS